MRLVVIVLMVGLSACAGIPGKDDVGVRVASWHGAPASDLVAVLGEPVINERGSWVWEFPGPAHGQTVAYDSHALTSHPQPRPVASTVGGPNNPGKMPGEFRTVSSSGGTYTKHEMCKYFAYVESGIVTSLSTLSKPGYHCRFDELPLRTDETPRTS